MELLRILFGQCDPARGGRFFTFSQPGFCAQRPTSGSRILRQKMTATSPGRPRIIAANTPDTPYTTGATRRLFSLS